MGLGLTWTETGNGNRHGNPNQVSERESGTGKRIAYRKGPRPGIAHWWGHRRRRADDRDKYVSATV